MYWERCVSIQSASGGYQQSASGCGFFFFQAEDGIRDLTVTGVQTCALPIYIHQEQAVRVRQRGGELRLELRRARVAVRLKNDDQPALRSLPQAAQQGPDLDRKSVV